MGTLWTIGHSTRDWQTFMAMLDEIGIVTLADVRRIPASRRHPQFAGDTMAPILAAAGIAYVAMPALGGRRAPLADSPNTAWRDAAFRGYADYMATPAYTAARDRLAELAEQAPTAVMCAEALWSQCHRGLIADDFKAAGWEVIHLLTPGQQLRHPFTEAARVVDGRLSYRAACRQPSLF